MTGSKPRIARTIAAAVWLVAACAQALEPTSDPFRVSPVDGRQHTTAEVVYRDDGSFLVAWYAFRDTTEGIDVVARLFDADGAALGPMFDVSMVRNRAQLSVTAAAAPDGHFVIAWRNSETNQDVDAGIYARLFGADGTAIGEPFKINVDEPEGDTFIHDPSVAMFPDGRFIVVWSESSPSKVVGRVYDAAGQPITAERVLIRDTFSDAQPEVAVDAQSNVWLAYTLVEYMPVITGQDVYVAKFDANGVLQILPVRVNPQLDGDEDRLNPHSVPSLALHDSGNVTVSWPRLMELETGRNVAEIYMRSFAGSGEPLFDAVKVTMEGEYADFQSAKQSVAVDPAGRSIVLWVQDGAASIRARALDPDGLLRSDSVHVAANQGGVQLSLSGRSLAFDAAGRAFATWSANTTEAEGGLFARRYAELTPPPSAPPPPAPLPDARESGGGALGLGALLGALWFGLSGGRRRIRHGL